MTSALGWFTAFHTLVSLIAIAAGIGAIRGLRQASAQSTTMTVFLVTALVTSVTGFLFPYHGFTPAIGVGIVATLVLVWAFLARRSAARVGHGSAQFALAVVISEYFLVFVLVAQVFAKLPALAALSASLKQPLFGATQLVVLIAFVVIAVRSVRTLRARAAA